MDTFARDGLPPAEAWPDLLLLDYPARLNAAVELLAHDGVGIAGGCSYAELGERAAAVASALAIEPGTRVLLHSPNTADAIAAWLGILLAGGSSSRRCRCCGRARSPRSWRKRR
jgi:2-aminobenzoate-CoA ligase